MAKCQSTNWHFSGGVNKACPNAAVALCRGNVYEPWEYVCQEHLDKLRHKKEVEVAPLREEDGT